MIPRPVVVGPRLAAGLVAAALACTSAPGAGSYPDGGDDVPDLPVDARADSMSQDEPIGFPTLDSSVDASAGADASAGSDSSPDRTGRGDSASGEGGLGATDSSDGPGGGALFDVGDLGDCSGPVAKIIPARICGDCTGTEAFALCEGLFYSLCSCDLPPGYTLVDAGAPDATPDDAPVPDAPTKGG